MKKSLILAFLLALTFATNAQNTFTKSTWLNYNLDTSKFSGTTSGGVAVGESKTFNLAGNNIAIIHIRVASKHETPASVGITLWGSAENATYVKVPLNSTGIFVTKSALYTYAGTWPNLTQPALSVADLGTAANWTSADTLAIGSSLAAGKAVDYYIVIVNPTFTWYKFSYTAAKSANTNAAVTTVFGRYWLRKAY
jgi:hypothetical protein